MEFILYALIFISGTLFGSFFTLAVYRIPLGEDILYKHSFCPNCKSKLHFKDLIPIISYIALGGKCAYCGQKIRIRYLLLEILSGTVFLLFALSLKLEVLNLSTSMIIEFLFFVLYIASLFIIAGIDKEKIQIQKALLIFGMVVSFTYMTYVCIQNNEAIYTYIIYLILTAILLGIDTLYLRKKLIENYPIKVAMLVLYMLILTGAQVTYGTIVVTLLLIAITFIVDLTSKRAKRKVVIQTNKDNLNVPVGFYLVVSNISLILICNFLNNWVI